MDLSEAEAVLIVKVIADLTTIVGENCPAKYSEGEEMRQAATLFRHLEEKFGLQLETSDEKQFWFQPEENNNKKHDKRNASSLSPRQSPKIDRV